MSRALVTLLTVGALLAGGGVAFAAWTSSGPGTVTARAGALTAPTATATAWSCGSTAAAPRFAGGDRAVEAFPAAAPTTTAPAAPLAATTTTVPTTTPSSAAPTTTPSVTPTTSVPAPAAATTTTTTTTVAPPTSSTSGVVTGLGAAAATLSWTSTGAAGYQFQAATTADFANPVAAGTTAATSATVTVRAILPTTVYLRVRGVVGAWTGPWSPALTTRAGPCLL
ncbi:hypothetical protein [Actinomycetospora atypica]|uniref:Fibronectin type-III domain-containing protein n=1 Tax=Actinomycetospora atypica TaxID=1290095 RepID=A0ABV9YPY0_9PSEU